MDVSRSTSSPFCGGTLIDSNTVLTAAHCAAPPAYLELDPDIEVWVGSQDRTTIDPAELIPVSERVILPAWRNDTQEAGVSVFTTAFDLYAGQDVAILQLDPQTPEQVELLNSLEPVELPDPSFIPVKPAETGTAIGWGTLTFLGSQPTQLQDIELLLLSVRECRNVLRIAPVEAGVLCASTQPLDALDIQDVPPEELIGVCNGDSGGPILVGNTQVGVASFVLGLPPGCARRIGYSGFVRLSQPSINRFIRTAMAANGDTASLN